MQLIADDLEVGGAGVDLPQQGAPFVLGPGVVAGKAVKTTVSTSERRP